MGSDSGVSKYKCTVVITCFNLQEYIEEAVLSALTQQTRFKFKVLVGDDCSSDNSCEILQQLEQRYSNLDVVYRKQNVGTAANVIDLYRRVDTDYVVHLDGDDLMLSNRIERTLAELEANSEIDLVCCELSKVDEQDIPLAGQHYSEHYHFGKFKDGFRFEDLIELGSFILPSSISFRASLIQNVSVCPEIRIIDDYLRNLQLMASANRGIVLNYPLSCYRIRDSGSTGLTKFSVERREQCKIDMILARNIMSESHSVDSQSLRKGIAGEYFSASLYYLRANNIELFKKNLRCAVKLRRFSMPLKYWGIFLLQISPQMCRKIMSYR